MNVRTILLAGLVMASVLTACKDKKNTDSNIITTDYQAPQLVPPIPMAADTQVTDVEWVGNNTYQVAVIRTPADSLPTVSDQLGQEYIDNVVRITVNRPDGTTFFARTFGKASFNNWLDADYRQSAILESVTFYGSDQQKLLFTASVNHPCATDDEAINLLVTVDKGGGVDIAPFDDDQRDDILVNQQSSDH